MYVPRPKRAVVHAQRNTKIKVRQKRPLFMAGECIASTYVTNRQKRGRNKTISTTAKASTDKNTYPAVPRLAELATD